ncbi:MAG: arylesterase [Pyrinomonadaceae bacterium]|nr:arylesterase [Pyrinomonadaceae bacterium]
MRSVIRYYSLVSFIFVVLFGAGCASSGGSQNSAASAKPLATPQIKADRPKVVAFGDSLTAGFGLLEKESYPYLLQQRLAADGFDLEVINAGVSGDTTLGGLERIDWVLEMENIKILILELGANDLMRGVPPAKVKANLDTMIRKAKAKNVRVLLCGMLAPPGGGNDYSRDFINLFPDLATEHKLDFLPFLLDGIALKKELNQADGIHPNAEGERLMTENVYKALKPMLAK